MAVDLDLALAAHLANWQRLLGLGRWRITWELLDEPIDKTQPVAVNHYYVRRTGRREAHIRFDRWHLRTEAQVERAVIHELLHCLDWGIGNDAHKLIDRLEAPLRRTRRLSRA